MTEQLRVEIVLPKTALWRGDLKRIVAEELTAAIDGSLVELRGAVVERTPANNSILRGAWQSMSGEAAGDEFRGRMFNPLPYARPVETGSRPHFPPAAALALWARRKLGLSEKEAKSVGYLIARAISRRGTPAAWMLRDALADQMSTIHARFEAARDRIVARCGAA